MYCTSCGLTIPYTSVRNDKACLACGTGMQPDVTDFLQHRMNGLIRDVRPGQVKMGQLVEKAIRHKSLAIIEGAVGVGKSFAYTIPALQSGERVVISTAKKQLQHQLAQKDVPLLGSKLEKSVAVAMVKGKSNYACELKASDLDPTNKASFLAWLKTSKGGDLSDWSGKKPFYWSDITAEDCVGARCKLTKTCGYWQAKRAMRDAKVVIANHHVVAWDLRFGAGKLLGDYSHLIIDEAHQAISAFRSAYTSTLTPYAVKRIIRAIDRAGFDTDLIGEMEAAWDKMFQHIHTVEGEVPGRPFGDHGELAAEILTTLNAKVRDQLVKLGAARAEDENGEPEEAVTADRGYLHMDEIIQLESLQRSIARPLAALKEIQDPTPNTVVYVNTTDKNAKIVHAAPINIGAMLGPRLQELDTVVLTSATMAIGEDFSDIRNQLGLDIRLEGKEPRVVEELVVPTPFDYSRQALLYTPKNIPMPVSAGSDRFAPSDARVAYVTAVADECARLIEASEGNAFVLFTATKDMRDVHAAVARKALPYKLLVQEDDAEAVFKTYMATPKSVIFGLKSFWEGVDVVGDKLRLVIITKLPFPQVNDPVLQARSRQIKQANMAQGLPERTAENRVFMQTQIPAMVTDLRQGAGRLIRSSTDRGVLAILDPRIWTGSGKRLPGPHQMKYEGYGAIAVKAIGFTNQKADFEFTHKYLQFLCRAEEARTKT